MKKIKLLMSVLLVSFIFIGISYLVNNTNNEVALVNENKERVNKAINIDNVKSDDVTTIFNGKTNIVDLEGDGEDSYIVIDDVADFAQMNGSSEKFRLSTDIYVPDSITSLGIEEFFGEFDGDGHIISNLNGPFINNLSGSIANFEISNPRAYTASLDINLYTESFSKTYYAYLSGNTQSSVARQYFGFVCGKVSSGTIDNVVVKEATIDTNGSTEGRLNGSVKTTGYMGFIAGYVEAGDNNSYIKNCTVIDSKLVHSSTFAVGGIVGYSKNSYIYGCLVRNLEVTGKNGVAISSMPKAFTGLIVGVFNSGGYIRENIVADISQGNTPYLSIIGAITHTINSGNISIKNNSYDETVADYSTVSNVDEQYEKVSVNDNALLSSNATANEYGYIYDTDNSSLGYNQVIKILNMKKYTSSDSLSQMITDMNQIIEVGEHSLKRNITNYGILNYVSKRNRVLAVIADIPDNIAYGESVKEKLNIYIDEENTNFETRILISYKYDDQTNYMAISDTTTFYQIGGASYRISYRVDGTWKALNNVSDTFEVKPFDISNAVISYTKTIKYNGYENSPAIAVKTPNGTSLSAVKSGQKSATDVGKYEMIISGDGDKTVGSYTALWEIIPGSMTASASNITKIYNANSTEIDVTKPTGSSVSYSLDGINYYEEHPLIKDVGEYTVYYKVSKANYEDYYGSAKIIINPATITVVWGNKELVYNGEYQFPSYTLKGVYQSDIVEVTEVSGENMDVGSYTAKIISINDNPNYILTDSNYEKSTSYKITPCIIEVPNVVAKEYTGDILYADIDVNGNYTIEGVYYGTNVGDYEFTLKPHLNYAWPNEQTYKLSYTFTITKATNCWISEPTITSWKYNDTPNSIVYEVKFGTPTIGYRLKGSDEISYTTPTEVGEYEAIVTVSNSNLENTLTKVLEFTIAKADPIYTIPNNLEAYYSDILGSIILPSDSNGLWAFKDDLNTLLDNVGEIEVILIYTPDDLNHYNIKEEKIIIKVNKIDCVYTEPTIINNLVYDGNLKELINAGTTSDGIFEYKVDDGKWSTTIPSCSDAKIYNVYYRIIGDSNHNDVLEKHLNVVIMPKEVEIKQITIRDTHISDDYTFIISNIVFSEALASGDYEIIATTLQNNKPGIQSLEVKLKMLNTNYVFTNDKIIGNVNITDHEANNDDFNCETAVTCKYCDYIFIASKEHSYEYKEEENGHTAHCTNEGCGYVSDVLEHSSSNEATKDNPQVCDKCGHIMKPALKDGLPIGAIIGIVVGVVFVASAAPIIIIIKKKKLGNKN